MTADVVPIAPEHIESYRRAVDIVARERRYLTLLEAFPLPQTRAFVLSLMEKGDSMFVALAKGEVVGWCDIQRHPFPAHSHRGTLGMGVVPDYRARGIGRRLMDQALNRALSTGLVRVELSVRADNARAIRLYEKFGFVREGVARAAVFVDGEFHDTIAMALIDRRPQST
ncbi:MAG TPA: GNAT family N-acetyltransferase [Roseiarcus sp.]|nr:GNAT family N-acetyltransferase [Roseiarcus sp.]